MRFEDKILAYLDGSLDESSRAELLHTLSVSPEKRALLEEHLRLRELMSFGHKPLNVPLVAERALANRIAVLGREMPHLVDDVTAFTNAGWMAGALQAVRGVFSYSAVRFATGTLALGAILWFATSRNGEVVSNSPTYHPQASVSRNSGDAGALSATSLNSESGSELAFVGKSGHSIQTSSPGQSSSLNDHRSLHSQVHAGPHARPSNNSGEALSVDLAATNVDPNAVATASDGLISQNSPSNGDLSAHNSNSSNVADNISLAKSSVANEVGSADLASDPLAGISSLPDVRNAEVPSYTLNDLSDAESALAHRPIRYEPEEPSSFAGKFSAWVGYGLEQSFGATLAGDPSSSSGMNSAPALGLNYQISDRLALGIESGGGNYSRIESQVKTMVLPDQPRVYQVEYTAAVIAQSTRWLRATFGLNLFSTDKLHFGANLGGGMTLTNGSAPMISGSAVMTYDLFQNVGMNAQLSYSGVWLKPLAAPDWRSQVVNGSDAVGILSDPASSRSLFTPALDLFVGLRYTF